MAAVLAWWPPWAAGGGGATKATPPILKASPENATRSAKSIASLVKTDSGCLVHIGRTIGWIVRGWIGKDLAVLEREREERSSGGGLAEGEALDVAAEAECAKHGAAPARKPQLRRARTEPQASPALSVTDLEPPLSATSELLEHHSLSPAIPAAEAISRDAQLRRGKGAARVAPDQVQAERQREDAGLAQRRENEVLLEENATLRAQKKKLDQKMKKTVGEVDLLLCRFQACEEELRRLPAPQEAAAAMPAPASSSASHEEMQQELQALLAAEKKSGRQRRQQELNEANSALQASREEQLEAQHTLERVRSELSEA
ncbi:unnamed protein product, partial [Prorocentrum cordatum]